MIAKELKILDDFPPVSVVLGPLFQTPEEAVRRPSRNTSISSENVRLPPVT